MGKRGKRQGQDDPASIDDKAEGLILLELPSEACETDHAGTEEPDCSGGIGT